MAKLTLSIDDQLIRQAKKLASQNNTSVSSMFARFIQCLSAKRNEMTKLGPLTRQATGRFDLSGKNERDVLTDALSERYGLSQ